MKTTVDIPDDILKRAQAQAAKQGLAFKDFLSLLLRRALGEKTVEQRRHRVKLPLVQGDGKRIINPTREELNASLWD